VTPSQPTAFCNAEQRALEVQRGRVAQGEGERGQRQAARPFVEGDERGVRLQRHGHGQFVVEELDAGKGVGRLEGRAHNPREEVEQAALLGRDVVVVDQWRRVGRKGCDLPRLEQTDDVARGFGRGGAEREERVGNEAEVVDLIVDLPLAQAAVAADADVPGADAAKRHDYVAEAGAFVLGCSGGRRIGGRDGFGDDHAGLRSAGVASASGW
jgi:hypothetical protein